MWIMDRIIKFRGKDIVSTTDSICSGRTTKRLKEALNKNIRIG